MLNLHLIVSEENKKYLDKEQSGPQNCGFQYWFSFPNGYAGSVVKGPFTYGGTQDLWELGVMDDNTKHLCYDNPITDDVLGYLTDNEVNDYLNQIKALPAK